jgi:hypothetical protein
MTEPEKSQLRRVRDRQLKVLEMCERGAEHMRACIAETSAAIEKEERRS